MTDKQLLIIGIVIVAVVAILGTAINPNPVVVTGIGAIVLQIGMGLLNFLKTQSVQTSLDDNTAKTDDIAATTQRNAAIVREKLDTAERTVNDKLNAIHAASNGIKDQLVRAAHEAGIAEGKAAITQANAIVVVGEHGWIKEWNQAATKLFGWTAEEVVGKESILVVPPRFRADHLRGLRAAIAARKKFTGVHIDAVGLHQNGDEIPLSVELSSWETSGGEMRFAAEIRLRKTDDEK